MKVILIAFIVGIYGGILQAQKTYVPDDHFEYYLETHNANGSVVSMGDANSLGDGVMNDSIPTSKIRNLTILDVHSQQITDLTGIEDFDSLQVLKCYDNRLNTLDVHQNTALTQLFCSENDLTALDLSQNRNLQLLSCSRNRLTRLEVARNDQLRMLYCSENRLNNLDVTTNTFLQQLSCHHNQLTSINVRYNTNLQLLDCGFNRLTNLDVSQNVQLEHLACNNNALDSLDVSRNTSLTWLSCSNNQIPFLDLTNNPELQSLYCASNQLTDLDLRNNTLLQNLVCNANQIHVLDLTRNTALTEIICSSNQLSFMDMRNGHNSQITSFNARHNPDLTCIFVDDAAWSQQHWTNIDSNSHFVETQADCDALDMVEIPINEVVVYPNPTDGTVQLKSPEKMYFVLSNIEGRILQQGEMISGLNRLDMTGLPGGIYLLRLQDKKGGVSVHKLIKR